MIDTEPLSTVITYQVKKNLCIETIQMHIVSEVHRAVWKNIMPNLYVMLMTFSHIDDAVVLAMLLMSWSKRPRWTMWLYGYNYAHSSWRIQDCSALQCQNAVNKNVLFTNFSCTSTHWMRIYFQRRWYIEKDEITNLLLPSLCWSTIDVQRWSNSAIQDNIRLSNRYFTHTRVMWSWNRQSISHHSVNVLLLSIERSDSFGVEWLSIWLGAQV
jgi:hypothetical protein